MATNEVPRGPISGYAAANVRRLREDRAWSLPRLSEELQKVGRPILPTGLHRLENGRRRVDVDDVTAIALAFKVSIGTVMLPEQAEGEIALTETTSAEAPAVWDWVQARRPLELPEDEDDRSYAIATFLRDSLPKEIRRKRYPPGPGGRELYLEDHPDTNIVTVAEKRAQLSEEALDGEHREAP